MLICSTGLLCGIAWLHLRRLVQPDYVLQAPVLHISHVGVYSEALWAKIVFIRDVCDGDVRKTDALVAEKIALGPDLPVELAVDQVYRDALALMGVDV